MEYNIIYTWYIYISSMPACSISSAAWCACFRLDDRLELSTTAPQYSRPNIGVSDARVDTGYLLRASKTIKQT